MRKMLRKWGWKVRELNKGMGHEGNGEGVGMREILRGWCGNKGAAGILLTTVYSSHWCNGIINAATREVTIALPPKNLVLRQKVRIMSNKI